MDEIKPRFLIDTTKGKDMKKGVTLVVVLARKWCITPFFDNFDSLTIDRPNTHLLVIDNTDKEDLAELLRARMMGYKTQFYSVRLYKTYRQVWKPAKKLKLRPGVPAGMWRSEHRRS